MKIIKNLLILPFSLFGLFLTSCSHVPPFSTGYEWDMALEEIEMAYYLDRDEFEYDDDVNIHISYGHGKNVDNMPEEHNNLPFCLFLDYGNDAQEDENDYSQYNGYKLIEEVEPKVFYTDEYLYSQEGYKGKKFAHTTTFTIPFEYFENMFLIRPRNTMFKIIAGQLYLSENDKAVCMNVIKSAERSLDFNYDNSNKRIKILL